MKRWKRWLSVVLCAVLLCGVVQLCSAAKAGGQTVTATLPFYTMSDIHLFPDSAQGSRTQTWLDACRLDGKMFNESETIIRTALKTAAARARQAGVKYLLLPGDLTKDAELVSHQTLAKLLEDFEKESGADVDLTLREPGGVLRVESRPDGETWLYGSVRFGAEE